MVIRKTTLLLLIGGLMGFLAVKEFKAAWEATAPMPAQVPARTPAPIEVSPQIKQLRLTSADPEDDPPGSYEAILTKNLFRPLGWEAQRATPAPARRISPPVSRRPETPLAAPTYVLRLTGIIEEPGQRVALIEDEGREKGYFLRPGESLKDAKILRIGTEFLVLAREAVQTRLSLGQQIRYDGAGHLLLDSVEGGPEREVASNAPLSPPEQDDLVERLRARRRRELSQP